MTFGEILDRLMKEHKMSREDLAKRVGVSYWTISKYVTNNRFPDPDTLIKISDIFGVSIDYLYGRENQTQAAHRTDDPMDDLPEEARRSLEEFKDYIYRKYGKDKR